MINKILSLLALFLLPLFLAAEPPYSQEQTTGTIPLALSFSIFIIVLFLLIAAISFLSKYITLPNFTDANHTNSQEMPAPESQIPPQELPEQKYAVHENFHHADLECDYDSSGGNG